LQSILAIFALIKLILRRKEGWIKTDKTGIITNKIVNNINKGK
jgi:hypothetical protein